MKRKAVMLLLGFCFLCFYGVPAWADKSSVSIEAPKGAEKNAEVVLRFTVTHHGNSIFHYTQWLKVEIDGKPAGRWDFTGSNRPEGATFVREMRVKAIKSLDIAAEASCNIHGGAGVAKSTIQVDE
jgi:desulfoferrodoxin (superoxide reductase-like protein)